MDDMVFFFFFFFVSGSFFILNLIRIRYSFPSFLGTHETSEMVRRWDEKEEERKEGGEKGDWLVVGCLLNDVNK